MIPSSMVAGICLELVAWWGIGGGSVSSRGWIGQADLEAAHSTSSCHRPVALWHAVDVGSRDGRAWNRENDCGCQADWRYRTCPTRLFLIKVFGTGLGCPSVLVQPRTSPSLFAGVNKASSPTVSLSGCSIPALFPGVWPRWIGPSRQPPRQRTAPSSLSRYRKAHRRDEKV
ncbi:hypothetical protein LZ30DRAFT_742315 [Colletotrichum cereale]|nr:hypothetical protein LZ30DRAFT_742315 [Colletotrichum cereale]